MNSFSLLRGQQNDLFFKGRRQKREVKGKKAQTQAHELDTYTGHSSLHTEITPQVYGRSWKMRQALWYLVLDVNTYICLSFLHTTLQMY